MVNLESERDFANPVITFPIKKSINTELLIEQKAALLKVRQQARDVAEPRQYQND